MYFKQTEQFEQLIPHLGRGVNESSFPRDIWTEVTAPVFEYVQALRASDIDA